MNLTPEAIRQALLEEMQLRVNEVLESKREIVQIPFFSFSEVKEFLRSHIGDGKRIPFVPTMSYRKGKEKFSLFIQNECLFFEKIPQL